MIWIIGNKGMLGRELCKTLTNLGIPFTGTDREVSIIQPEALKSFTKKHKPSWIVNCSAYTAVDKAEEDKETAYAINYYGVANIASLAAELDIPLVHISTDYVFDGTSSIPLSEDASTNPVGIYGASKLAGEEAIRKMCTKYYIIRTAWLYGQFGSNFVYTMLKLMNKLESIKVVDDQQGSPTWTKNLADLILAITKSDNNNYGTYHFSGEGDCSWYNFAEEIYRLGKDTNLINSDCRIYSCLSDEFTNLAKRPAYSLLSKEKVKNIFSYVVPSWQNSLKIFIKGINNNDINQNSK